MKDHTVRKEWAIVEEPRISLEGKTYIPDLVLSKGERVLIVDPTVVWERKQSLKEAAEEKTRKYTPILEKVCEDTGAKEGKIYPMVIGARGAWYDPTNTALMGELGVTKSQWKIACWVAVAGTLKMLKSFFDEEWR